MGYIFLIKCLRNNAKLPNNVNIENIICDYLTEERVRNIYVWYLFDIYVKNFDKDDIYKYEKGIKKIIELIEQKDPLNSNNDFPCPYTIGVFKLLKAYKKPNLNINKIQEWIVKLNLEKLSRDETQFIDADGKVKKQASDYEEYYSVFTSLLQKQSKYQECIEVCDIALSSVGTFHYDNDIWFKRRKALSLIALGDIESGENILLQITKSHKGQKWFIYQEIAQAQYDADEYEEALVNCCKAALCIGDEDKKVKLFLLMARCYYKLKEQEKSKLLAELISLVIQKYELNKTDDIEKILNHFKIAYPNSDVENNLRQIRQRLIKVWKQDQLRGQELLQGKIHTIHKNNKSGHLTSSNESFFFGMSDVQCNKDNLKKGVKVEFYLKEAQNQKGEKDNHAVIIRIIE